MEDAPSPRETRDMECEWCFVSHLASNVFPTSHVSCLTSSPPHTTDPHGKKREFIYFSCRSAMFPVMAGDGNRLPKRPRGAPHPGEARVKRSLRPGGAPPRGCFLRRMARSRLSCGALPGRVPSPLPPPGSSPPAGASSPGANLCSAPPRRKIQLFVGAWPETLASCHKTIFMGTSTSGN